MCIHNAYLSVPGGKKCLLCGAVIPDIAEMPATTAEQAVTDAEQAVTDAEMPETATEQAENAPEEVKPDKSTIRKTTRKTGK